MEIEDRAGASSDFGILLRRHRIAAGLSQGALAELARMSSDGISALERGHRRTPQRETVALLAGALALNLEQRREFEAAAVPPSAARRGARVTVGPWSDGPVANLPLSLSSFVGRENELAEVTGLIRGHRFVTITGAGGVGKTQTALRVATALSDIVEDGVRFVALAPIADPTNVAPAVALALGLQEVPNRPLLETIVAYIKNKAQLLLFDNCEHLITEVSAVASQLLLGCPRLRILATSREALQAAGERAYRLPSLSIPEAVDLFTDRARAVDYHFALTDEDTAIVADLCGRLDGIPLAIELAAARVQVLTPREMMAMLERQFGILSGGDRIAPPRHQTMRATLEWSYELLSKHQQILFDRLSIFSGGCTLDLAVSVCANEGQDRTEILELLSSLVNKSLLTVNRASQKTRYIPLESFRQFGHEKLAARGELDAVAHRHALAFLEAAERFYDSGWVGRDDELDAQTEEMANWRTALEWTLSKRGDVLCGQRIVGRIQMIWNEAAPAEGQRWIKAAFDLVDSQTPLDVLAGLYNAAASASMACYNHKEAYASSQRAMDLCRSIGDTYGLLLAQGNTVVTLVFTGRPKEAKVIAHEALQRARDLGLRRGVGVMLRFLGLIALSENDLAAARALFTQSQKAFEDAGLRSGAALVQAEQLSTVEFLAGNHELALAHVKSGIEFLRSGDGGSERRGISGPGLLAEFLGVAVTCLIALTRYDEAEKTAHEMLDLARDNAGVRAVALEHLGAVSALRPSCEKAVRQTIAATAVRLLGFADAQRAASGAAREPLESWEYDRAVVALQGAMVTDTFASYMAQGAAMTEEMIVHEALSLLDLGAPVRP